MTRVLVIPVTKETCPRSTAAFRKKLIVPFGDCLRITHKVPRGFEIKLGHFQKLYPELTKYTRSCLFKNALFAGAIQSILMDLE